MGGSTALKRFPGGVAEKHRLLNCPRLGDAMRKISGAGPVAQQSWLASKAFRGERDVARITEASVARNPPKVPRLPKLKVAPKSKQA